MRASQGGEQQNGGLGGGHETHLVKTVFSAGLQRTKSYVEVFSAQGKDPTSWSQFKGQADQASQKETKEDDCGLRKFGIRRKYDAATKGLFITVTSHATLPKPPLRLNLVHSYLIFQCFVPAKSNGFRCCLTITDEKGEEKALAFSSMLKNALINNPIRKCLPLPLQTDVWMNLVIDLADLVPFFFDGAQFVTLDRIELEAACRLRRIFTTSFKPSEEHFVPGDTVATLTSRTRNEGGMWRSRTIANGPNAEVIPPGLLSP